MKNKTLTRNFLIFIAIVSLCVGVLLYGLISSHDELSETDDLVINTYDVINKVENLSTQVEAMVAAQRGYLLTTDAGFLNDYDAQKANISELIASLSELIKENPSQESRLDELRFYFNAFSASLEERAQKAIDTNPRIVLDDVEDIQKNKKDIIRINEAILNEEYSLLNQRIRQLDNQRIWYFTSLFTGVIVSGILFVLFNAFLFFAQRGRSFAESTLRETQERLELAIEGTKDGIFDWDIDNERIFLSAQFYNMIGYENEKAGYIDLTSFNSKIHPADQKTLWTKINRFLKGDEESFTHEFRIRAADNKWVWLQSRAKALYNRKNEAVRMIGAVTDVTPMIKTQKRLLNEKNQAEEANKAKSEFLAHMSHEIRTPLTAINGIAEIFERSKKKLDEKQQRLVHTLSTSVRSLKELINDILDFSKIESGEIEVEKETFDLQPLFEEIISMMNFKAKEKNIEFIFNSDGLEHTFFLGDRSRLKQILMNLVNNAIKFTENGRVEVNVTEYVKEGVNHLRFAIKDTGIGIEKDNLEIIFERFKQADSSVSRKYGGTGLGLPISKRLAILMNGDITVESQPGQGSCFTLELPNHVKHVQNNKKVEADNKDLDGKIAKLIKDDTRALIVEDYEGNVVILSYILDELNIPYDIANNGVEGVDAAEKRAYDFILMDIQMPEMDGFTATAEIHEIDREKKRGETPIIGMTAHALVEDKNKCIEAGMVEYLPKPIIETDLKSAILGQLQKNQKKSAA